MFRFTVGKSLRYGAVSVPLCRVIRGSYHR